MRRLIVLAAFIIGISVTYDAGAAHCFCKWVARDCFTGDTEVQKDQKDGFIQPVQAEGCRNYCRGLWDASGNPAQVAKKLPNGCGDVTLSLYAALGTMSYGLVRGPQAFNVGGTCERNCVCPTGHWLHSDGKSCVTGTGCSVPGVPNQTLSGGYFFWEGNLFKITGPATCTSGCKR